MKIVLNDNSRQLLLQIMQAMGIDSPTHAVQCLITNKYKSLVPQMENNSNDKRSTS
jgi:hypothetical protein